MSKLPGVAAEDVPAQSRLPPKLPSTVRAGAMFAGGNLLSALLRAVAGALLVQLVSPGVLGLFNSVSLVAAYAPVLQFGVWNGLGRELPLQCGRGDQQQVEELAAAGHAWSLLMGAAVGLVVLVLAAHFAVLGQWAMAGLWATNALVTFLLLGFQSYLEVTFRTGRQFARLSVATVAQSGLALLSVPLVAWWGIGGLCVRAVVISGVYCGLLWRWRPLPVRPQLSWAHLRHLWKIGLPIFVVGEFWRAWTVLDTTLVLRNMGTEAVGVYSLTAIVNMPIALLVGSVSQMVYPRMVECYGRTGRLDCAFQIGIKPTLLLTLLMAPLVLACWMVIPACVHLLAPEYVGGIEAARWSALAQGVLAVRPLGNLFNAGKRQDLAFAAVLAGAVAYLFVVAWLGGSGYQLHFFPLAMLCGNSAYLLTGAIFLALLLRVDRYATGNSAATSKDPEC